MKKAIRTFAPTAIALELAFAGALATQARANVRDFGPLKDVIAVRSAFGAENASIASVRVCDDWAQVDILFGSVREKIMRRSHAWKYDPDVNDVPASAWACFAHIAAAAPRGRPALPYGRMHVYGMTDDLLDASDDAGRIGDYSLAIVDAKLAAARAQAFTAAAVRDLAPFLTRSKGDWILNRREAKAAGHDPAAYAGACAEAASRAEIRRWEQASREAARARRSEASLDASQHPPREEGVEDRDFWDIPIVQTLCPE